MIAVDAALPLAVTTVPVLAWPGVWLGWTLHIAAFLMVCAHILRNRREATSALLWIFVTWSFPVIGALLYLAMGVDRVPDQGFRKQVADDALLAERQSREFQHLPLAYWRAVHEAEAGAPPPGLIRELDQAMDSILPGHPLLNGNAVEPLIDGDQALPRMLEAIDRAQDHIHLQTFILRDETGRQFLEHMAARARAGVKVRFMYDRFGSTHAHLLGLIRSFRRVPNMAVAGWTQANPLKRQFQINLRNHRKILVVDGREAYCGGINIHRDNLTRGPSLPIRDYHFALRGPIVQELQYTFLRDWYFMTDEDPAELLQEKYFPHVASAGRALVRLVNSGPNAEAEAIGDTLFLAIVSARSRILMVTPYLVPPAQIVHALRAAAQRGVDVRVVVPGPNNHRYAKHAARALYSSLLEAGVRIFERREPFMHAKALLVDDLCAIVGTANMDIRSLRSNYETNLVVYEDHFLNEMKHVVLGEFAMADEIQLAAWRNRSLRARLVENFCSLLTPVL